MYPAGFLPLGLGILRDRPWKALVIYRDDALLQQFRGTRFRGRCGRCAYADLCGGSRARAYAASGDPLGEDPAVSSSPKPGPFVLEQLNSQVTNLSPRIEQACAGNFLTVHLPAVTAGSGSGGGVHSDREARRVSADPVCETTPRPPTLTDNPFDHNVECTGERLSWSPIT